MTASEQLCVSLPNNACRELATIVTCTMHGLRHAPGSNHVWVSFLGVFTFSFVISKFNLQSSDETTQLCRAYSLLSRSFSVDFLHPFLYCPVLFPRILSESAEPVRKGNHYYANLCEKSQLLLIPRASPFQLRFFSIVPFLLADYIRISNVHLLHIYLLRNICKKQ